MSNQNAAPNSPLASRSWRRRHSVWLLAVIFGFGFASFIGFLYCAIRVGTRKWWLRAGMTFAVTVPGWIIMSVFSSTEEQRADMLRVVPEDYLIILWIVLTGYGFVVNRDYLRWRADPQAASGALHLQAAPFSVQLAPPPGVAVSTPPSVPPVTQPPAQRYEPGGRVIDL